MTMGLTRKQSELLEYLTKYIERTGYAPTFSEMADGIRLHSKSGIKRLVMGLEERGRIRCIPNRARAIEVVQRGLPVWVDLALQRYCELSGMNRNHVIEVAITEYFKAHPAK